MIQNHDFIASCEMALLKDCHRLTFLIWNNLVRIYLHICFVFFNNESLLSMCWERKLIDGYLV